MNKHQLFKELFNISQQEAQDIAELTELMFTAKEDFKNVGVSFSYDTFKEYVRRRYAPMINNVNGTHYTDVYKRQLQILDGDNLDIIEDAAEKKGLL